MVVPILTSLIPIPKSVIVIMIMMMMVAVAVAVVVMMITIVVVATLHSCNEKECEHFFGPNFKTKCFFIFSICMFFYDLYFHVSLELAAV